MTENEMQLPDGETCKSCAHCKKCTSMFGVQTENTECDFNPSRFVKACKHGEA